MSSIAASENVESSDPFKMTTGGFIDMKKNKRDKRLSSEEAIGTAFAAETNTRDEDAEMFVHNLSIELPSKPKN